MGLDAAQSTWVLFVDADEILPPEFALHVRSMISAAEAGNIVAYRLRYTNLAFGRTLHSTLVGSAKYSLMLASATRFPHTGRAHVPPQFDGQVSDAPNTVPDILHLNFRGAEQTVEKTMRYARDMDGEPSLLTPTGLIRELARATIFGGVWKDGYAGVAVATSAVVGWWYAAFLRAERAGVLGEELPPREVRRLRMVSRWHAAGVLVRDGLRSVFRSRKSGNSKSSSESSR
jgi:hypothetical protein